MRMLALRRVAQVVGQPLVLSRIVPSSARVLQSPIRGLIQGRRRAIALASSQATTTEETMSTENGHPAVSAEEVESLRKQLETLQVLISRRHALTAAGRHVWLAKAACSRHVGAAGLPV
jgi:hypothetical protein